MERPTLDVEDLRAPQSIRDERRRRLQRVLKKHIRMTEHDKKTLRNVLQKYRRRQEKLLDGYESDPDPYENTYVFYCLEAPRVC